MKDPWRGLSGYIILFVMAFSLLGLAMGILDWAAIWSWSATG